MIFELGKEGNDMRKMFILSLIVSVIFIGLSGCSNAGGPDAGALALSSQPRNSSGINSQSSGSAYSPPEATDEDVNSQPAGTAVIAQVSKARKENIWKLIDEGRVEDITPVFETARYILDSGDDRSMRWKNIDYGALSFFKVDGRTGVVDDRGEIKIPYEDNAGWCIEGFVDELHRTYDGEFNKEGGSGHGISSFFFDLNSNKLVMSDEDGYRYIQMGNYIENHYSLTGIFKAAYFKIGKSQLGEDALVMERQTNAFIALDDKGNPISKPNLQAGTAFYKGISAVKKDNKWGFIDRKGNMILDFQYDDAYNFVDDTAAVCKDGRWGYIKRDGSVYKDFIYDAARSFYKGRAWAKLDGKWQVITE